MDTCLDLVVFLHSGPNLTASAVPALLGITMSWHEPGNDSSADGSEVDESSVDSPVESVRSRLSYVRSRERTHVRVGVSPPGSGYAEVRPQNYVYTSPLESGNRRHNARIRFQESIDSQTSDDSQDFRPTVSRSRDRRRPRSPDYSRRSSYYPLPYSNNPGYSVDRPPPPPREPSFPPFPPPPSDSSRISIYGPPPPIFTSEEATTKVGSQPAPHKTTSHYNIIDFADDSDDENIKVHHIINIRPSHSIYDRGSEWNPKLRSRVFTQQSSFKPEENVSPETYHIVHMQLMPRDDDHDVAILTYDVEASVPKPETQWMYVWFLKLLSSDSHL